MDSYNSFLFLILGVLAVSRPSESQINRVALVPRWGTGGVEIGPVKSSPGDPIVEPLRKTLLEKIFSRKNKNEGMSETDPLLGPSTSNGISHSDPFQTVEGVNNYGGRVSNRNADLKESAPIENHDRSALSRLEKLKSALDKKEEPRKTSEPIDIDYSKSKDVVILYDSTDKRVLCIYKTYSSSIARELVLGEGVGEEFRLRGVETMHLYEKKGQAGREYVINIPKFKPNINQDETHKLFAMRNIKVEPVSLI